MSKHTKEANKRLLKIQFRHYYMRHSKTLKPYPVIRIAGLYLEMYDFKVGDAFKVTLEKGKITIEKLHQSSVETNKA